jgi:hypothetical protein
VSCGLVWWSVEGLALHWLLDVGSGSISEAAEYKQVSSGGGGEVVII